MLHDAVRIVIAFGGGAFWMWVGVLIGVVRRSPRAGWRKPIEAYTSGEAVYLDSYAGGAWGSGAWSQLSLRFVAPGGNERRRSYTADDIRPGYVAPQEVRSDAA